jgi:hypothetical protein
MSSTKSRSSGGKPAAGADARPAAAADPISSISRSMQQTSITKKVESSDEASSDDDDDDDDNCDADLENEDEPDAEAKVSKLEQLWIEYEKAKDRKKIQSKLLRRALGGAMTKKGQHKAHWMDLELITYAIRTAHGKTQPYSRAYLMQLAVVLAADNHRNTSADPNVKADRAVVKELKNATTKKPYMAEPRALTKLSHQLKWMQANVKVIATPIMRRLWKIMENVVCKDGNGKIVPFLDLDFPTNEARVQFEECWKADVKKVEAITIRSWNAVKCKRELRVLEQERKEEQAQVKAQIEEKYNQLKLKKMQELGFKNVEELSQC